MIVAIQPAYGDAWTRRQFAATLDRPVPFASSPFRPLLSPAELALLVEAHPDGRAGCWGGTRSQSSKIAQLQRGDLVLLTGQLHVRGVGAIGAVVDNQALAHALWGPHPRRCSFEVVYSLSGFRRVELPYPLLQSALGTSDRDNFQALRLVRDRRRVEAVRELLGRQLALSRAPGGPPAARAPAARTD